MVLQSEAFRQQIDVRTRMSEGLTHADQDRLRPGSDGIANPSAPCMALDAPGGRTPLFECEPQPLTAMAYMSHSWYKRVHHADALVACFRQPDTRSPRAHDGGQFVQSAASYRRTGTQPLQPYGVEEWTDRSSVRAKSSWSPLAMAHDTITVAAERDSLSPCPTCPWRGAVRRDGVFGAARCRPLSFPSAN